MHDEKTRRTYNLMLWRFFIGPCIRQQLSERCVLLIRHILRLSHPEGFVPVELLPLVGHLTSVEAER